MDELLEILNEINPDVDFMANMALVDDGILTSFELVSLVTQISSAFDVEVPPEAIVPDNFNSAGKIYQLIQKLEEDD